MASPMPPPTDIILIYYISGLIFCIAIGALMSKFIFKDLKDSLTTILAPLSNLSSRRLSTMIKLAAIFLVLAGGLSAKFYSCNYKYETLISNRHALTFKVMDQIEGGLRYLMIYLILILTIFLVTYLLKKVGQNKA